MTNINFQYDGSNFTIFEEKSGYQQSLETCKKSFGKLLDMTTVNIDEFTEVFNKAAQKSRNRIFRTMSINKGRYENSCYGLTGNKLKRKNLSQIVHNVCYDDHNFDKKYASICQAPANKTEVLSITTNSSLSTFKSNETNTNVIAGAVTVALVLVVIATFIYIWKKRSNTAVENVRKQVCKE